MKRSILGILFLSLLAMVSSFIPTYKAQVSSPYTLGYYRRTFASLGTPANGRVYYCTDCTQANPCASGGSGAVAQRVNGAWQCGSGTVGSTSPGGNNTYVQFNDSSAFGGDAGMVYNKTTDTLTVAGQVTVPIISGGTNALEVRTAGSSFQNISIQPNGATTWTFGYDKSLTGVAGSVVVSPTHKATPVAFASLPASPEEGMIAAVTDSNTATWGATVAGGGSNHVLVYYNGTNWTVAAK